MLRRRPPVRARVPRRLPGPAGERDLRCAALPGRPAQRGQRRQEGEIEAEEAGAGGEGQAALLEVAL